MAVYRVFMIALFARYKLPFALTYDLKHRQLLGASRSFSFASMNYQLYIMTFDSNAIKSSNRCSRCSATDHLTFDCPFRVPGQAGDLPRGGAGLWSRMDCHGLCRGGQLSPVNSLSIGESYMLPSRPSLHGPPPWLELKSCSTSTILPPALY